MPSWWHYVSILVCGDCAEVYAVQRIQDANMLALPDVMDGRTERTLSTDADMLALAGARYHVCRRAPL